MAAYTRAAPASPPLASGRKKHPEFGGIQAAFADFSSDHSLFFNDVADKKISLLIKSVLSILVDMNPRPEHGFGFLLHDIARLLRKRFDQRAATLGLSRAQWQVLAHLHRHEGINQSGLADILEIKGVTLGRLVDRLEAAGWVERRADLSDRRARRLYTTAKVAPVLERMWALGEMNREEALAGLGDEDRRQLVDALLKIRSNLSERGGPREVAPLFAGPEPRRRLRHG